MFYVICYCIYIVSVFVFFFSSRRRHTRCALVTGVQTCALPIFKQSHLQTLALVRKRTCRGVSPLKGVGRISMTSCQAVPADLAARTRTAIAITSHLAGLRLLAWPGELYGGPVPVHRVPRSEEHTSELQSLMRISYAVFCLTKNKKQ